MAFRYIIGKGDQKKQEKSTIVSFPEVWGEISLEYSMKIVVSQITFASQTVTLILPYNVSIFR